MENKKITDRQCCANCVFYSPNYCHVHDVPTDPWAICDQYKSYKGD